MKTIRIASGQGFWGDMLEAPVRQVEGGPIDLELEVYRGEVTGTIISQGLRDHWLSSEVSLIGRERKGGLDVADGVDQRVVGGPGRVLAVTGDHLGVAHRDLR